MITVFTAASGGWKGVYNGATSKGTFDTPEEAMQIMEAAVLEGRQSLLGTDPGWRRSKDGGYYWISRVGALSVKQARSGKWYISRMGEVLEGLWYETSLEAMRSAEAIHGVS